jgi:hypothetical protein
MVRQTLLISLIMLAVFICLFDMMARGMNLRVVFFIEREVLNSFHDISLSHVYHSFNIIDKSLMLNLGSILDTLLNLHWILVDLGSQLSCYFDFNVCLGDIILENQKHCLVAMQQNLVFMRVEILR